MLFIIHAMDRKDGLPTRLAHYDAHKAYLAGFSDPDLKIVTSGPLVEDDGVTMKGSLLLVDARSRADVERFHDGDPFKKAGVWAHASITAFVRRVG